MQIVGSVVFRRPYHRAPVSPLFFDGRRQDLAFEKPSGVSASTRHHVRFWKALDAGDGGRPVWLGAAVFDDASGSATTPARSPTTSRPTSTRSAIF